MEYQVLMSLMVKVALLVAAGYGLKKLGILTDSLEQGMSGLILKFVLPCSVIAAADSEFGGGTGRMFLVMALIALGYFLIAIGVCRLLVRAFHLGDSRGRITQTLMAFANTAFLGYPIMQELFGKVGFVYAVVYNAFFQLFFFTYGISCIRGSAEKNWRTILLTPMNGALAVMILLTVLQIRLPEPLQDTLASVGNMMVPLSMMVIGCSLVGLKPAALLRDRECYRISFVRLLGFPVMMLLLLRFLRTPEPAATIGVIMAGLPSGSLNVIAAKEYGCESAFAARAVVQTMMFGVVTVPFVIFLSSL